MKGGASMAISRFFIMNRIDAIQYCKAYHKEKTAVIWPSGEVHFFSSIILRAVVVNIVIVN